MRFLVTGATSGLGRNAVEWLLAEGHQVHATGRDKHIGKQLIALGACFTALDLVHAESLASNDQPLSVSTKAPICPTACPGNGTSNTCPLLLGNIYPSVKGYSSLGNEHFSKLSA